MSKIQLELLSPAKDLECGIVAINCGADAVYIGAPKFGARAAAGNSLPGQRYVSQEDLKKLILMKFAVWDAKLFILTNFVCQQPHDSPVKQGIMQAARKTVLFETNLASKIAMYVDGNEINGSEANT
jgi:collagenase-like PrtC family protease